MGRLSGHCLYSVSKEVCNVLKGCKESGTGIGGGRRLKPPDPWVFRVEEGVLVCIMFFRIQCYLSTRPWRSREDQAGRFGGK